MNVVVYHWISTSRNQKLEVLLAQGWYRNRGYWRRDDKGCSVVKDSLPQPVKYPPAITISAWCYLPVRIWRLGKKGEQS